MINSLDYFVFEIFIQYRKKPDVNSYIGRGKVEEILNFIKKNNENIDLIVLDGKLKRGLKNIKFLFIKTSMGNPVKIKP